MFYNTFSILPQTSNTVELPTQQTGDLRGDTNIEQNSPLQLWTELHFWDSGGFKAARLPGQATCMVRTVGLWVKKNPVPPPNHRALDWSVVLTVGGLCPIITQDNIVVLAISTIDQNLPGQCLGLPGFGTAYAGGATTPCRISSSTTLTEG